jgi:NAD(P)H-hydrate epimerase
VVQGSVPEAVYVDSSDAGALREAVQASRALGVGPGMGTGEEGAGTLRRLLEIGGRQSMLMDADALNLVAAGRAPPLADIARERPVVITPHPGEMARLTGTDPKSVAAQRPRIALDVARDAGAAVLMKGAPSLVATPQGRLLVDTVGSSDLAAAGMGDVLSGTVSAFLAQGSAPDVAAALALHTSGRAAVRADLGPGLTPEDVVEALPEAIRERGPGQTDLDFPFVLFDQDRAR